MANAHPATHPSFKDISHLGELLIVIFYAEAYREAVTKDLWTFEQSGSRLRSVLMFLIFLTVTVRFFVGNYLHLADTRWDDDDNWQNDDWRRRLYYVDTLFIALESLAMIVLGSFGSAARTVSQLVIPLILISSVDVVWTCFQWLVKRERRPLRPTFRWMWLNLAIITLLTVPYCWWHRDLSDGILICIAAVNVTAFVVDMIFVNEHRA
jgi:hypothetical protein